MKMFEYPDDYYEFQGDYLECPDDEYEEEKSWEEMTFWERHLRFDGLLAMNGIVMFRVSGRTCRKLRPICRFLAPLLTVLTVATVISAVVIKCINGPLNAYGVTPACEILIMLLSLVIHEFGHLIAAMGYGYYDPDGIDMGILLLSVLPIGMYVEAGDEYLEDTNKTNETVFLLDGCAMNILLASVCFMISSYTGSDVLARISGINFALGITNLFPWYGLDGDKIIANLLDLGDMLFVTFIFKCLKSKECRKKMRSSFAGIIVGTVFFIIAASQVIFIMLVLISPLWLDLIIREDESLIYDVFLRIYYYLHIKFGLWK